jgi:RNA polymerase sigma-70 factor (ECF subfamily)
MRNENLLEIKFERITGMNFSKCYKEYMPKLTWYLASTKTKNIEKAEEYAHRAIIQGLEKIDTYDSEKSQLITWLTQIAKNLVIKDYKDSMRIDSVSIDAEIDDTPGIINIIEYDNGDKENEIHDENVKKCEIIKNTIYNLPSKYRTVMLMREVEKMHYKDIADSISKTTKSYLTNGDKTRLTTPEDFFSLYIENVGSGNVEVKFVSSNKKDEFIRVVEVGCELTIVRQDIKWERLPQDEFYVISSSSCHIVYVTTTNLSTIKSQIKKGRSLVKKKVKRPFELMND